MKSIVICFPRAQLLMVITATGIMAAVIGWPKVGLGQTTIEINQSLDEVSRQVDRELGRYIEKIEARLQEEPETKTQLQLSQKAWIAFRKSDCEAIYKHWKGGSTRGAISRSHYIKLTRRRTHDLWEAYLTFMDSTPPLLEEPKIE